MSPSLMGSPRLMTCWLPLRTLWPSLIPHWSNQHKYVSLEYLTGSSSTPWKNSSSTSVSTTTTTFPPACYSIPILFILISMHLPSRMSTPICSPRRYLQLYALYCIGVWSLLGTCFSECSRRSGFLEGWRSLSPSFGPFGQSSICREPLSLRGYPSSFTEWTDALAIAPLEEGSGQVFHLPLWSERTNRALSRSWLHVHHTSYWGWLPPLLLSWYVYESLTWWFL